MVLVLVWIKLIFSLENKGGSFQTWRARNNQYFPEKKGYDFLQVLSANRHHFVELCDDNRPRHT